jgi:hypothetical protein
LAARPPVGSNASSIRHPRMVPFDMPVKLETRMFLWGYRWRYRNRRSAVKDSS